jgi:hypothetical protein
LFYRVVVYPCPLHLHYLEIFSTQWLCLLGEHGCVSEA